MSVPVRAARSVFGVALLLAACGSGPSLAAPDMLRQESDGARDSDAGAPARPPAANCESLIRQLQLVFAYPSPVPIKAAASSREGEVVLAFDGVDRPALKLLSPLSERGGDDLLTLLPASARSVTGLSKIRAGRILVSHRGDTAGQSALVSSIDLRAHTLEWSRPVRDLSGKPRPAYVGDTIRGEWSGPDLAQPTIRHVVHLEDGRYNVLAEDASGMYLYGFARDGAFRFRTLLAPSAGWSERIEEREDGSLAVAVDVGEIYQDVFRSVHPFSLGVAPRNRSVPVVLTVTDTGELTGLFEADVGETGGHLASDPVTVRGRLTWFISLSQRPSLAMLSVAPDQRIPRADEAPFAPLDLLGSTAAIEGGLWVAGRLDRRQGFKTVVSGGRPFIGRIASDGSLAFHCERVAVDTSAAESWNQRGASYTLHDGEVPLLSVLTPIVVPTMLGDTTTPLRVYRMIPLDDP